MPKAGGTPTTLADGLVYVNEFKIHDGFLYFTEGNDLNPSVKRVSVSGGEIRTIANGGERSVAVHGDAAYMVSGGWGDHVGVLLRVPLSGINAAPDTVARGFGHPRRVYSHAGYLYVTDHTCSTGTGGCHIGTGLIWRVDPRSFSVSRLVSGLTYPTQLAFDEQFVYYTSGITGGFLGRVPLGGGTPVILLSNLREPTAVATDGHYLYFTEWNHSVKRLDLSTGAITLFEDEWLADGSTGGMGLAIDGSSAYWGRFWRGHIVRGTPR